MVDTDKYSNINDDDFDNLILNFELDCNYSLTKDIICISCDSINIILENDYLVCKDCGYEKENIVEDKKLKIDCVSSCKSCKSSNLITDNSKGYLVCRECGTINKEYLDERPDLNNNQGENNSSSRYGPCTSIFFKKSSLGSKIVTRGYNRLSQLQNQGQMPYKEKSLMDVLEIIQQKCKKYCITQPIIDSAKIFYKKVSESVHNKGKRKGKNIIMRCINRRSMIAACLFHACKLQNELRSPKEIADIYDLEIKHVNRGCRKFCDILEDVKQVKSSESFDFIERYTKILNIDSVYVNKIKDIAINVNKFDLATTHEPTSVAAGCLLLFIQEYDLNISKKKIAETFNISDVTLAKTLRKISPYTKILINNNVTNLIINKINSNKDSIEF
jgi:transcription initiation factor TFIIB